MASPRLLVLPQSGRHGSPATLLASPGLMCVAVLVLAARSDIQANAPPLASDDCAISVGRWDVVAVEWNGTPVDKEWLARLQVVYQAVGSWGVLLRSIPVAEGTSTNRQDVTPKTFEMETLGSEGIKPRRYKGIYQLDGDTRVFCIVPDGNPRPDDFSAPRHSGRVLVRLERAKDPAEISKGTKKAW